MRPFLFGALLSWALTFGVMTLTGNNAVPAQNCGSQIVDSPNAMILNFHEAAAR